MSWGKHRAGVPAEGHCKLLERRSAGGDGARLGRSHMFERRKVPDERGARLVDLDRVAVDAALRYLDPLHRAGSGGTAAGLVHAMALWLSGEGPGARPRWPRFTAAEWLRALGCGCPRGRSPNRLATFRSQSDAPIDASPHGTSSSGTVASGAPMRWSVQGGRWRLERCGTHSGVVWLPCTRDGPPNAPDITAKPHQSHTVRRVSPWSVQRQRRTYRFTYDGGRPGRPQSGRRCASTHARVRDRRLLMTSSTNGGAPGVHIWEHHFGKVGSPRWTRPRAAAAG